MRLVGIAFALSVVCSACTLQMADAGDSASSTGAPLVTPVTSPANAGTSGVSGLGAVRAGTGATTGTSTSGATQMAPGSQTVNPAAASTSCVSPGTPQCEPEPQPWEPSK
jgi:hypothetical protein